MELVSPSQLAFLTLLVTPPTLLASLRSPQNEVGLKSALDSNAVEVCISNLSHADSLVKHHACATLGFLCFADSAKVTAIQNSAVPALATLLSDHFWKVRSSAASALSAVMQTDSGKKVRVCELPEHLKGCADTSLRT